MKRISLGTIGPIALALAFSGAAYAADVGNMSGTLNAGYAVGLGDSSSDIYGASGTLQIPVNVGWTDQSGFEVIGGYRRPDVGGVDFWNIGGALYAGNNMGRVAADITYHSVAGASFNAYGAGGEWFATPNVNLAVRGGGLSGDQFDGGYVGAQGAWYACPDFALSVGVDYWSAAYNMTSEIFQAEWLPSETLPVSVYTGFQHLNVAGGDANTFFVGVKLYVNGDGAATLLDRQRNGTNGYIVQSPMFLDQY